jgi:large subunit ribosomal protein L3
MQLLCRKIGTTQLFVETGECIPVTVLEVGPNTVVQKKTEDKDGYSAIQVGYGEKRAIRLSKPELGHFEKAGVAPKAKLYECRLTAAEVEAHEIGQELSMDLFTEGQRVDVIGTSKGRGTAGVIKRHHMKIKRKTHGTHENTRHGGSIGAGAYPGRVFKGMHMSGRMGNERVTQLNLEVVRIEAEKHLLFVRGAVPGHNDGLVKVRASVKARS